MADDYQTWVRESYRREASDELRLVVDQAVRSALVAEGLNVRSAGAITDAVLKAVTHADEPTLREVVEAIKENGGFIRVNDGALIDGRFVRPATLISALVILGREPAPAEKGAAREANKERWHWARISGHGSYSDLLEVLMSAGWTLHGSVEGTREEIQGPRPGATGGA